MKSIDLAWAERRVTMEQTNLLPTVGKTQELDFTSSKKIYAQLDRIWGTIHPRKLGFLTNKTTRSQLHCSYHTNLSSTPGRAGRLRGDRRIPCWSREGPHRAEADVATMAKRKRKEPCGGYGTWRVFFRTKWCMFLMLSSPFDIFSAAIVGPRCSARNLWHNQLKRVLAM